MAKILIIDDEAHVRAALGRVLRSDGHEVLEASNGAEATAIVEGEEVNLVFTDIFMPEMDGIEFLLWVVERFPDRAVVAMSGGGAMPMDSALGDARALGAVDIVEKPLDPARVRQVVREALGSDA
ncbi:MAG: response regulator [Gemmatimonadota bacterium]|nr:response regulator [Gemmatimonadota bacterium]